MSRALKADEADLRGFVIARDGIAVIVHARNPIQALTDSQIVAIYTGQLRDWHTEAALIPWSWSRVVATHKLAQARRISDYCAAFWTHDGSGRLIEFNRTDALFSAPNDPLVAAYLDGRRG
ncbi:hypothetical protein RM530_04600 [Algiphilus sp. W345]|uniref:PBP domain-containing protein n=1 Tax=Banduia mediterranea TaxID=3075609 RepID=A0ABU2WFJ5_9GAMM|nr:substrate-binding domain-containing protein [Algiphilus sp. W345]MDT0496641.1 hypothetical protein [Algiphilus sp. W345]